MKNIQKTEMARSIVRGEKSAKTAKNIALLGVFACAVLLGACANTAQEGDILTTPVVESHSIGGQASDALTAAEQSAGTTYVDLTQDILDLIDALEQDGTALSSDFDALSISNAQEVVARFFEAQETPLCDTLCDTLGVSLLNALANSLGYTGDVPQRAYFTPTEQVTLSAQEAVDIAVEMMQNLYGADTEPEAVYIYYEKHQVTRFEDWCIFMTLPLEEGSVQEVTLKINAISGELNLFSAFDGEVLSTPIEDVTQYTVAVFEALRDVGLYQDGNMTLLVMEDPVRGHDNYTIAYETTTGTTYYVSISQAGKVCYILNADRYGMPTADTGVGIQIIEVQVPEEGTDAP